MKSVIYVLCVSSIKKCPACFWFKQNPRTKRKKGRCSHDDRKHKEVSSMFLVQAKSENEKKERAMFT